MLYNWFRYQMGRIARSAILTGRDPYGCMGTRTSAAKSGAACTATAAASRAAASSCTRAPDSSSCRSEVTRSLADGRGFRRPLARACCTCAEIHVGDTRPRAGIHRRALPGHSAGNPGQAEEAAAAAASSQPGGGIRGACHVVRRGLGDRSRLRQRPPT